MDAAWRFPPRYAAGAVRLGHRESRIRYSNRLLSHEHERPIETPLLL